MTPDVRTALAGLLRHESKSNTYKFALIRALNDLALDHPLMPPGDVVVPLRRVAERWLVYYWPFVGEPPIFQGPRAVKDGKLSQDMSFRPALTRLRLAWETLSYARRHPADGALLLADHRVGRGRLPAGVQQLTLEAVKAIAVAVRQPVRFAGGTGAHGLFGPPGPVAFLPGHPLPGSFPAEPAFTVPAALWAALSDLSLWVDALCLHEWCLYTERLAQDTPVTRGDVFTLLTATPEARVPLTWERHQVRLLMLEGTVFFCPWTQTALDSQHFDLDHLIPLSAHPINELWNLLPSDPRHNAHVKRQRIPAPERLAQALPQIEGTYGRYARGPGTAAVLARDVQARFGQALTPPQLAAQAARLAERVAQARNIPRY